MNGRGPKFKGPNIMAKKGRNVARKTMSRFDDLLEAAGFLAAPEAQKKRIEDALAECYDNRSYSKARNIV